MNEVEWNEANQPQAMLAFLQDRVCASDRKLRLFGCACVRRVWHLLKDGRSRAAVEAAERYCDGADTATELARLDLPAWDAANEAHDTAELHDHDPSPGSARWDLAHAASAAGELSVAEIGLAAKEAATAVMNAVGRSGEDEGSYEQSVQHSWDAECAAQAALLRCIIGPLPFRAVSLDPAWQTPAVQGLAQRIYTDRSFERMAELADLLQEAGSGDAEMLAHLRGAAPHVRGCWALDLILGKQ